MYSIVIPMPDSVKADVLAAFSAQFGYAETVTDPNTNQQIPNPVTREQFVEDMVAYYILDVVKGHLLRQAMILAEVEAEIELNDRAAQAIAYYDYVREHGVEP